MAVRRVLLAAPLLAVLGPVLAGCGGGDNSVADPPISSAPTSSPTTQERETPEHFIRRFVAISNAMEMRGGTSNYLHLTSGCHPCRGLAKQIDDARSRGGFYRSKGWSIKRITNDVTGSSGSLDVSVTSAPTSFRRSDTAQIQHYTGGDFTFRIGIRWMGTDWRVTSVAQVAT
jgi:hypothetical protein